MKYEDKKFNLNKIFPKKINLGKKELGSENLLVLIPKVLSLKKITIKKGKKGGLQFHRLKNECGYLLKGKLLIKYLNKNGKLTKKNLKKEGFPFSTRFFTSRRSNYRL